jgi:hypothetical protein
MHVALDWPHFVWQVSCASDGVVQSKAPEFAPPIRTANAAPNKTGRLDICTSWPPTICDAYCPKNTAVAKSDPTAADRADGFATA